MAGLVCADDGGLSKLSSQSLTTVDTFKLKNMTALSDVSMPNLRNVSVLEFTAVNFGLSIPNLPALVQVSNTLSVGFSSMTSFWAPNLTTTGELDFSNNSRLNSLNFPKLDAVRDSIRATNTSDLAIIYFPMLHTVGGFIHLEGKFDRQVDVFLWHRVFPAGTQKKIRRLFAD